MFDKQSLFATDATTIKALFTNKTTVAAAPTLVPVRKHFTGAEVAKFLREREGKGLEPVDRMPWVIKQISRGARFDGCGAEDCQLGIYVGIKYARVCHRCMGDGVMTAAHTERFRRYNNVHENGRAVIDYSFHNDTNRFASIA